MNTTPVATTAATTLGWYERSPTSDHRDLQALLTAVQQTEDNADKQEKEHDTPVKKKRVYKKRKSTHLVRKEERQTLKAEIQDLETTLEALKLRALVRSGEEDTSLREQITQNTLLRDALQEQHLVVAKARAMLVGCAQRHSFSIRPMEMYIHLAASHQERRSSLLAVRGPKLQSARQFIESRSLGLLPAADYLNEERFETSEGDLCNVRLDRVPLFGVKGGVQAVFNALKQAIFNAEIIMSEATGHITIREDDDMDDIDAVAQMKLVSHTAHGVVVENNLVHFSELVQAANDSDSYALATADFVDQDDRFPYRPQERVRRDATSVILVTPHKRSSKLQTTTVNHSGHTSSEEDTVIVITRWSFVRICHTELDIPRHILQEKRDQAGRVSDTILNCVREMLGLKYYMHRVLHCPERPLLCCCGTSLRSRHEVQLTTDGPCHDVAPLRDILLHFHPCRFRDGELWMVELRKGSASQCHNNIVALAVGIVLCQHKSRNHIFPDAFAWRVRVEFIFVDGVDDSNPTGLAPTEIRSSIE